jgi:2'-5' RNA ligase
MEELSARHGTPRFVPHLTLLGGIGADDWVARRAQWLASSVPPFDLTLGSRAVARDDYWRAVVVEALPSVDLLRLHHLAREAFDRLEDPALFEPHLSLLYGDLPAALRHGIVQGLPNLRGTFRVDSLGVWSTEGVPGEWREVASFPLSGAAD